MGKFDFSGYATKNNIQCSDGRVICKDAFKHNDGATVPLVWQHSHNDPSNVLGHALLENRADGVYAYCKFNSSEAASNAKLLVEHGDITALSIYANQLKQNGNSVLHGAIKEVSLVLAGANPGALIDNLAIQHSDGEYATIDSEAIIYSGEEISMNKEMEHADTAQASDTTVKDVFESFTDEQKDVVYYMIGAALEEMGGEEDDAEHSDLGGDENMKKNVFEGSATNNGPTLSHADIQAIMADAQKCGSLKEAVLAHAGTYGIDNIDYLFPDAKSVMATPDFIKRDMEWVSGVISGTKHTPFARIKSMAADITPDAARAKGYVTGAEKTEEVFALLKRVTYPTTIYKKQKLDRDDIIDITDMDVVAWLKAEMRMMLDEELARAVLVGDGRDVASPDKIDEACIRPIYKDEALYAHKVELASTKTTLEIIEDIMRARENYKGSGNPAFYTTTATLNDMLLVKDKQDRRLYNTEAELASALRVSRIVEVPVLSGINRVDGDDTLDLVGIIVNLNDYVLGADKGGQISMFDDFDIDFNQYKYLMETRCSGALVHPKSALVIEKVRAAG